MSNLDDSIVRRERQQNEINALKAIFEDELEVLREQSDVWHPLDFLLSLGPQQGSSGAREIHAHVQLHVECCHLYPEKAPKLEVAKSKGLSTNDVSQLMQELEKLVSKLIGQEMVFEIAQHVQGFLHKHNKPGFKSFHEEMLLFQKQQEQQQQQLNSLREQKERQAIQDEVHRKQEALRAEGRIRRESLRLNQDHSANYPQSDNYGDQSPDTKPVLFKDCYIKTTQDCVSDDEEEERVAEIRLICQDSKNQSRILSEFEMLKFLGKGAFGDVLKVRNKLDGRVYAIKRIELNPRNRQLNRRITREVKLLSQLNHENVVRYYNSWIESATVENSNSESSNSSPSAAKQFQPVKTLKELAPAVRGSVEWSVSSTAIQEDSDSENDSDTDSDGQNDEWLGFLSMQDTSDSIVFENGSEPSPENIVAQSKSSDDKDEIENTLSPLQREIQFMYIQMEFCEKSTLRTAIDEGLCQDETRVWRLFREIVEGLAHIHQQGMIHRDLKPVNIFLDSQDHVKIGDFGLATMSSLPRNATKEKDPSEIPMIEQFHLSSDRHDSAVDQSLTSHIGTALYVAPEVNNTSSKAMYNQKVDIYSLGVIFFEMCYPPLQTGMERISVLHNLRSKQIIFPVNFPLSDMIKQAHVIRWLLDHEPSRRPSSEELLASDSLPPPQLEDAELQDMVRHTLRNPQSKAYKYLVASCFKQEVGPAEDVTFDMAVMPKGLSLQRFLVLQDMAKGVVVSVFKKHGAVSFTTPLLMPQGSLDSEVDSIVRLMTRWGGIVCAPHDLRVNFARYVVWNNVSCLKRYAVQRVYREKRVYGFHPRELYECAFDIVTTNPGSLVLDAELLAIAWEVASELPGLKDLACAFRLNHTALIRAALFHSCVSEDRHFKILSVCSDARDKGSLKQQLQGVLNESEMASVFSLLEVEGPFSKVSAIFRGVCRRKGPAASLAKQGLRDLENIISYAQALGVKCPLLVSPVLVRNINQYSGIMFQLVCENKNKHRHGGVEVIAAGGRYDAMIAFFRQALDRSGMLRPGPPQSAVGVSICLDKVVSLLHDSGERVKSVDVVLWSSGHQTIPDAAVIAKELWGAGMQCLLLDNSEHEAEEFCQEMAVPLMVILREGDSGSVRVRSWERERLQEKKVLRTELLEFLHRALRSCRDQNEGVGYNMPIQRQESKSLAGGDSHCHSHSHAHSHRHSHVEVQPHQHQVAVNVNYLSSERMAASSRKRYQTQIFTHTLRVVQKLEVKVRIEVLAVCGLDGAALCSLAGLLDLESEQEFNESRKTASEKLSKNKKIVTEVLDEIYDLRFEKNAPVIILYSLLDNKFRLLV
ncbi:hypothetical protein ONE63_006085 [Megalurothrips usitatus]|uniref:non-specific serine/threonine protein kinase n=1 Tax=Megalurothrips usitatus TaxID=439358 RepID=A0AAV7XUV9_9NEOP|nr:hypothetical protein ONE63_006085 [Megalurothrips usitatus]